MLSEVDRSCRWASVSRRTAPRQSRVPDTPAAVAGRVQLIGAEWIMRTQTRGARGYCSSSLYADKEIEHDVMVHIAKETV